ncbi:hypothetical protein BSK20_03580 [SR1 bacterium human oral taxon HOT-345]|nr:hypothetical protein BSK20_03580 [SR1 bacterium human oral taxon HOT-345]
MTEKELIITHDTEGFTADDYLHIPSYATAMEEYGEANLPEKIVYNNTPILDQGSEGACSVFGITKAENEADWFDSKTILDAMKIRKEAIAKGIIPDGGKNGWSMSGALKLMKDLGYIQGYYFCNTAADVRLALSKKHMCYTGARYIRWHQTGVSHMLTPDKDANAGHLFALTGIDNEKYHHPNSWTEGWGDKGFFYTPFGLQKWLYSIVAIIDKKNASPEVVIDSADSEKMVQMNIRNGKLPNESLIKLHAVLMVMRAFYNEFDNDRAIQKALQLGIVRSVNGPLTKRRFLKMIFVAMNGRTSREELIPDLAMEQGIIKNKVGLDEPVKRYHASLMIARGLRFSGRIE